MIWYSFFCMHVCCLCFTYLLYFIFSSSFFFNAPATPNIYTLSLHDALPISAPLPPDPPTGHPRRPDPRTGAPAQPALRSEEHTSELQSHSDLVCRLLLEKKKKKQKTQKQSIIQY